MYEGIEENGEKSRHLFDSFFSQDDMQEAAPPDSQYPEPAFEFELVTDAQIYRAIDRLHPSRLTTPRPYKPPKTQAAQQARTW